MPEFNSLVPDTLIVSGEATCTTVIETEEEGAHECGKLSRFVIERSDGDTNFGSGGGYGESCEEHLVSTVAGMVDGDVNIQAVVTIRWDEPEPWGAGTDDRS